MTEVNERLKRKVRASRADRHAADSRVASGYGQRYYHLLVARIQSAVDAAVPAQATVMVVSRGDANLLTLGSRDAWHFPRAGNQAYAGHYPADSKSAIAHLEELRDEGAEFILFPATSLWWLEYYTDFGSYLDRVYSLVSRVADEYALYDIRKRRHRGASRRRRTKEALAKSRPETPSTHDARTGSGVDERHSLLGWFDPDFYRARYPDIPGGTGELLDHYLRYGWKEGRDPCSWFSSTYYLSRYADIRRAGMNPFVHYVTYGKEEGRLPSDYRSIVRMREVRPSVSAIVPNYNHARFLEERLWSIASQSYKPAELIILDDASTDKSRDVISSIADGLDIPVRTAFNASRSGNVFRQWRKGLSLARGDLVWICESDDYCDESFLAQLVPHFGDPSVTLAFGRIQFADRAGVPDPWLDEYREQAKAGYWAEERVESAYTWFRGPFGLANVIPNVGGCLFRRQSFHPWVWRQAQRYSVCGDWYLYMQIAGGGRIAYDPKAMAYFRQHEANTSVAGFSDLKYYREHSRVAAELRRVYGFSDDAMWALYQRVREHYFRHFPSDSASGFHRAFNFQKLLERKREVRHILIGILGFQTGGAELFPIHLANSLHQQGHNVSVLVLDYENQNPGVRSLLRPEIPVYERLAVEAMGSRQFFDSHQFDVIHTHYQGVDRWISQICRSNSIPYVVTLHGSHEMVDLDEGFALDLAATVDHWVYTADKNLTIFDHVKDSSAPVTKLRNAVPDVSRAFPVSRSELAPERDAVLFGVASRALRAKGWEIAIHALEAIRERAADRPVYLALCGDGGEHDELIRLYGDRPGVRFLGYQSEVTAFYRLCDCCVLPTRFPGESFPFTLIESLKAGTPIVATDVGEIRRVVQPDHHHAAGIVVPPLADDHGFTDSVAAAMEAMLDDDRRAAWAEAALSLGESYSFQRLTSQYEEIYSSIIAARHR